MTMNDLLGKVFLYIRQCTVDLIRYMISNRTFGNTVNTRSSRFNMRAGRYFCRPSISLTKLFIFEGVNSNKMKVFSKCITNKRITKKEH